MEAQMRKYIGIGTIAGHSAGIRRLGEVRRGDKCGHRPLKRSCIALRYDDRLEKPSRSTYRKSDVTACIIAPERGGTEATIARPRYLRAVAFARRGRRPMH